MSFMSKMLEYRLLRLRLIIEHGFAPPPSVFLKKVKKNCKIGNEGLPFGYRYGNEDTLYI